MKKSPKKLKYRKYFKTRIRKKDKIKIKKDRLDLGFAFLQVSNQGKLFRPEIEASRVSVSRMSRKRSRIWRYWQRLFTYCPVYKKTKGLRMGKGKGHLKDWYSPVKVGQLIFILSNKRNIQRKGSMYLYYFKAFAKAWRKLSVDCDISLFKY